MLTHKNHNILTRAVSLLIIITATVHIASGIQQNEALESKPHSAETTKNHPQPAGWLILDGTRNVSFNMVHLLESNNIPCTVLVKPSDMIFADAKLPRSPLTTILECDFTDPQFKPQNISCNHEVKYLFMDPEHDVYKDWHNTVTTIVK
jgi:hypothetical protein